MREIRPHIANTVPRLLEKIYDNIINKGKNLPWLKKQIFFWAVNLGLRFRLTGNTVLPVQAGHSPQAGFQQVERGPGR
jgi:long-subunit acyl-CoA synthetase (AMP-forming)